MSDKKPDWLKKKIVLNGAGVNEVKNLIGDLHLNTVCESAMCPNIFECFANRTATFMIMGDVCTRNCSYCNVRSGKPDKLDEDEPRRVAGAVKKMGLKYVVVTSVTRDDLPDGGSHHFARTIKEIKKLNPGVRIECLVPDFNSYASNMETFLNQGLDVLNHNTETVERIFRKVKRASDYKSSLGVLKNAKSLKPGIFTKSGFMLGLGERGDEVMGLLSDLKEADCDILTIGQYLRPSENNTPVVRYYSREEFDRIGKLAEDFGFKAVSSGVFVRSSYKADYLMEKVLRDRKKEPAKTGKTC
ncbi:MAG: lipoyl synthase [Actinomycetota bacterium]|nr:lipoyl synthase [Actinomycetota bacterium]